MSMLSMAIQRHRKKLEEIESRFYSWTHLSDQQEEDITWLITNVKDSLDNMEGSRGS